jgi:alpha 1,2-mannosyltransferase
LLIVALIPKEYWSYPRWVNKVKAEKHMREMSEKGIIYGGSLSYRHMCRFNSGFFYRLEIMQKYDFYWRVEPCIPDKIVADVVTEYYCDVYYDPFKFMRENGKKYGWVMSMYEFCKSPWGELM